jgi:hypothetical protein
MPDPLNVFISYARQDGREYAARLDTDLRAAGFRTWRDTRDIDPNQDFSAELEEAISNSTHVVCCITPDTVRKDSFVRREIGYALAVKKPIIPLVFERTLPPIQIINVTRINANTGQWVQTISEVVTRLNHPDDQTAEQATPPDDPYRDYLNTLYEQIVHYLNRTVFSLVTLRSEATPEAVESSSRQVLPMAFFDMAGIEAKEEERQQFSNFNEAFEHYGRRVLLLGEPGAGKTTTLFAFARDAVAARLADATCPLPILVPIATWDAKEETPLTKWLANQISTLKQEKIQQLIADNGHILLILDGLDELGKNRVDEPTNGIHDPRISLMSMIPTHSPTVISCRQKDYFDIGEKALLNGAVTLQPLSDSQMRDYLEKLPNLWEVLESDTELREVARTPLLLSLFTFAFRDLPKEIQELLDLKQGELRDKIFEIYVKQRYEHERRKLHANVKFTLDEIQTYLGELALDNVENWRATNNVLWTYHLSDQLGVDRWEDFLDLTYRLHFLTQSDDNSIRFIHLLLRDYFAYRQACVQLYDGDNFIRSRSLYAFGELRDVRAVEYLINNLSDPDVTIRATATLSLGKIGHPNAVDDLLVPLSDSEVRVRTYGAIALGELNDIRALVPLLTALRDSSATVCAMAAVGLERIGTPEALAAVEEWRRAQGNER